MSEGLSKGRDGIKRRRRSDRFVDRKAYDGHASGYGLSVGVPSGVHGRDVRGGFSPGTDVVESKVLGRDAW